ncbi:MAG TPA: LytTR family DNA-binding domain-containing protein [Kofleriaceae bacterium]|jgi:two-component system LytT family response regulator|nr:LytTR family DNA-binding domain-containing protein [Kofleriaceae bacterium]
MTEPGELRVVVVEDEPAARRLLVNLLTAHPDVRVIDQCRHGKQAVAAITALRPDLVFLDIKIPELDGFGVIEQIGAERMPPVVFVTAYDEFAVRAFDVHALDYLVKPFSDARFEEMLHRARRRLAEAQAGRLRALLDDDRGGELTRFAVRLGARSVVVAARDVEWIEAQDYYAVLHVAGATHLVRQSIRALEGRLDPRRFARINRSAIVNLDHVRQLERRIGHWTVRLRHGTELPVSRRRRTQVARWLGDRG